MSFYEFRKRLSDNFNSALKDKVLYEVDIDKDRLWNLYLDSFPEGTNPIYLTRREHDCCCCRHFLKEIGGTVYIDRDMTVHSIFEFFTGSSTYQPVMDALAQYVRSCPIKGVYLSKEETVGTDHSRQLMDDGKIAIYYHFHLRLPAKFVHRGTATIDTKRGEFRDTRNVFKRSLDEISEDAIETVLELIRSNTLYKGAEWESAMSSLLGYKREYDALDDQRKEIYCWYHAASVGQVIGRIRNHSIGVLLTDISCGAALDEAVRRYESIVAPANYKRPKAIFTKKMLEDARKTVTELGYMDALPRRFATLDDITVNNILFSNRDAAKRISGTVFDDMLSEAKASPKQFSRVEEIGIEKFIADVLPNASEVQAYVENRHAQNMVSLIAPVNKEAKPMFKWANAFSWAYTGNMTDSDIKKNVKAAGGRVDGVLRFSIQWNDMDEYDRNDLDAHCIEHGGEHIYFGHKRSCFTDGNLDIDIIDPSPDHPAVENITFPDRSRMMNGEYRFFVRCYSFRGGRGGFRAEIEFDGQVYRYDVDRPMRNGEEVEVAVVCKNKDGSFSIRESLPSETASREVWGVKTNSFVPVTVIMNSPNYWDEQQGIGHKHYMFMLKDCVNPERPNGFYNEFLKNELAQHKRVFEALGAKMSVADVEDQLSGLGFSSTKRNELVVKVKGSTERIMKIKF